MEDTPKYLAEKQDTRAGAYAEHQNSAPEVSLAPPAGETVAFKHSHEQGENGLEVAQEKPKRGLMGRKTTWAIVAVVVLVVVGAVVGGVVGAHHNSKKSTSPSSATSSPSSTTSPSATSSGSATSSSTANPSSTGLTIIQAVYAAIDETQTAQSLVQQNSTLDVNLQTGKTLWNITPDPWVDVKKCVGILHKYGSSIRTFVGCDGDGSPTLQAQLAVSPETQAITHQGPNSTDFSIVSVVWGSVEVRDKSVYTALYQYKTNGSQIPFETYTFGGTDSLPGTPKSGIIWYTEDNFTTFKSIFAREGTVLPI